MRVGHAARDITPKPGLTLSGFIARRNQPSQGVDDPLWVHALALESAGQVVLLLAFDLLGLGPEITSDLYAAVEGLARGEVTSKGTILCCTHTHSAPATVKLLGCGLCTGEYREQVVRAARAAAEEAIRRMRPARVRYVVQPVKGISYNRRNVLADGRVVMAASPDAPVAKVGPTWDTMLLVRFDGPGGEPIAGIAHWAAHPCVVCSPNVTADYPGQLRQHLSQRYGMPFVFLQGACGNLNLPLGAMTRPDMLARADELASSLQDVAWSAAAATEPFGLAARTVALRYQPAPTKRQLTALGDGMGRIAETGEGPDAEMAILANILNVKPGDRPEAAMLRFLAGALRSWSEQCLAGYDRLPQTCELALKTWVLGELVFCAVGAEVFAETALAIQQAIPGRLVNVVGYAGPLVGYLPTDEALDEGGYEVDHAYRFYGHPSTFAKGSEPAVVRAVVGTVASIAAGG